MWLTHYSPSIVNPEEYLYKATEFFSNSKIGKDLMLKVLKFED
jgi:ribonuclease Z